MNRLPTRPPPIHGGDVRLLYCRIDSSDGKSLRNRWYVVRAAMWIWPMSAWRASVVRVKRARREADYTFLEFGLLLMVTGLFVVVFITGLVFVFWKEAAVSSSWLSLAVAVFAIGGLLAFVLFLVRRLRRFIIHR